MQERVWWKRERQASDVEEMGRVLLQAPPKLSEGGALNRETGTSLRSDKSQCDESGSSKPNQPSVPAQVRKEYPATTRLPHPDPLSRRRRLCIPFKSYWLFKARLKPHLPGRLSPSHHQLTVLPFRSPRAYLLHQHNQAEQRRKTMEVNWNGRAVWSPP